MGTKRFTNAGIFFDYCRHAMVPEIPSVEDVLYVLGFSPHQKYYDFSLCNHGTYVANVGLVIAAIGDEVLSVRRRDEREASKIIAKAIMDLCPPEATCLFNHAFVEARKIFLELPACSTKTLDAETLRHACDCPICREDICGDRG